MEITRLDKVPAGTPTGENLADFEAQRQETKNRKSEEYNVLKIGVVLHMHQQDFEAQREEIKNRNSEEYNVLKIQLEGIIEELERHFEQAHRLVQEDTPVASALKVGESRDLGAGSYGAVMAASLLEFESELQGNILMESTTLVHRCVEDSTLLKGVPGEYRASHPGLQAPHPQ
eukprot:scaffold168478_cov18-Tisochrysis_lutea.AAC.1